MIDSFELPLFPLRTVLFPGQTLPLHIFEPRYQAMIADCMEGERTFGVVLIQEGMEVGGPAVPYEVGTMATIQDVERLSNGRMNIFTIGRERFQLQSYDAESKPYLVGQVSPWPWSDLMLPKSELSQTVQKHLARYVDLLSRASEAEIEMSPIPEHPAHLAVLAAVALQISPEQKQTMLEIPSVGELLRHLNRLIPQESRGLQFMLASAHLQPEMDSPFSDN